MAISFIDNLEAFLQNSTAFLKRFSRIPLVRNGRKSEILRESSSDIVLSDVISIEIYTGKMSLAILEPSNNEVVVEWILLVSFLVADSAEVISVVFNCEVDAIVE